MVVPVSAQISKLHPRPPHRAVAPCHSTRYPLSSRRPSLSATLPTTHYSLSSHLHHVASISLPFSAASAYFPSPRACTLKRTRFSLCLGACSSGRRASACPDRVGVANPMFSAVCRLFVALCTLFDTRSLCFQSLADSFPKTPGGGGCLLFRKRSHQRVLVWGISGTRLEDLHSTVSRTPRAKASRSQTAVRRIPC